MSIPLARGLECPTREVANMTVRAMTWDGRWEVILTGCTTIESRKAVAWQMYNTLNGNRKTVFYFKKGMPS